MDYKAYLTQNVIPFWLKNGLDREKGGIYLYLDEKGKLYGDEKGAWFQGRALYTLSRAYNSIEKNPEYLEAAKLIYGFLKKIRHADGRLGFKVSRSGETIEMNDFDYSEMFAAIGCAEYYLASGDKEAADYAEKFFETAYGLYKDLMQSVGKTTRYKQVAPSMIILSTAQIMRKLDDKYDDIVTTMLTEITTGGNVKDFAMLENVSPDGDFVDSPEGRLVNPGHSLECAWFLMSEGARRNDKELILKAKNMIDVSMKLGFRNGGIISFCDVNGNPPEALEWDMHIWWPQCEAMIANRLCHELTGEEKYLDAFKSLENYVFTHFADNENGEWYGYMHYDGTVANTLKGNISKGLFHLPRMLMQIYEIENHRIVF